VLNEARRYLAVPDLILVEVTRQQRLDDVKDFSLRQVREQGPDIGIRFQSVCSGSSALWRYLGQGCIQARTQLIKNRLCVPLAVAVPIFQC